MKSPEKKAMDERTLANRLQREHGWHRSLKNALFKCDIVSRAALSLTYIVMVALHQKLTALAKVHGEAQTKMMSTEGSVITTHS